MLPLSGGNVMLFYLCLAFRLWWSHRSPRRRLTLQNLIVYTCIAFLFCFLDDSISFPWFLYGYDRFFLYISLCYLFSQVIVQLLGHTLMRQPFFRIGFNFSHRVLRSNQEIPWMKFIFSSTNSVLIHVGFYSLLSNKNDTPWLHVLMNQSEKVIPCFGILSFFNLFPKLVIETLHIFLPTISFLFAGVCYPSWKFPSNSFHAIHLEWLSLPPSWCRG